VLAHEVTVDVVYEAKEKEKQVEKGKRN